MDKYRGKYGVLSGWSGMGQHGLVKDFLGWIIQFSSASKVMTSIGKGKYQLGKVIAAGSFGKVFEDGDYAIKEMKIPSSGLTKSRQSITALLANEVRILTQLNHANIVKVYEVLEENGAVYIVMERCEDDLRGLTEHGPCGEARSVEVLRQVVAGCEELLRQGIVHRDLKPANILLSKGKAKLADFGMAKFVANQELLLRSHVGTPYYMAPQVLQRIEYTRKCDIWSLGVIFYELLCGQLPWNGRNELSLLDSILNIPLTLPITLHPSLKDLLTKMLAISETQRPSLHQLDRLLELHQRALSPPKQTSFHWTAVRKMLLIQANHRSQLQFHRPFLQLSRQQRSQVEQELRSLLREQDWNLLQCLPRPQP